jgi:hypothetical protein
LILLFIVELTQILVFGVVFNHGIDDAGEFVGRGLDGQLRAVLGLDPAVVGSESTLAMVETSRSKAKGVCCPVGGFLGLGTEDFSAGDFIVGTKAEPGSEVFAGGPFVHVYTGFRQDHLHSDSIEAVDLGKIDTGESIETGAEVKGGILASTFLRFELGDSGLVLCGEL